MGSNHDHPVDVDPQALKDARAFWNNFGEATKYGIIGVVAILALMAFFLV